MPTKINDSNQTITQYNVQTGAANNLLNSVAPGATSGVPLISQGASSQPVFGTATVPGGGTGATSLTGVLIGNGTSAVTGNPVTQYDVLVGGASNAITSVSTSNAGYVLTSAGTGANPYFAPNTQYLAKIGPSGGFVTFDLTLYPTYGMYAFVLTNIAPATNANVIYMQTSNNGGSTYINSGYTSGVLSFAYNSASPSNNNASTYYVLSGSTHSSGVGGGVSGIYYLTNIYDPSFDLFGNCTYTSAAGATTGATVTGHLDAGSPAAITNLQFTATGAGGINSFGSIVLYGIPA